MDNRQINQGVFELFHVLTDPECIEVRKLLVRLNLHEKVKFRNIDIYDEHCQALVRLTSEVRIPCLHVENKVYVGRESIEGFLHQNLNRLLKA